MNLQINDTECRQFSIQTPPLTNDVIHIWQTTLSQYGDKIVDFWAVLNKDEQDRAVRFIQTKHQHNFVIARAILRYLLAQYLQCRPWEIVFQQNDHGKLMLMQPLNSLPLQFNLSHANDVVMYAFVLDRQVGIDVEYVREDISLTEIARRFFAFEEQQILFALPPHQQLIAFYNCWTRKEAFIKAIGKGLSYSLNNFVVDVSTHYSQHEADKINLTIKDKQLSPALWSLFNIKTFPQYCAAMTVTGIFAAEQLRIMLI